MNWSTALPSSRETERAVMIPLSPAVPVSGCPGSPPLNASPPGLPFEQAPSAMKDITAHALNTTLLIAILLFMRPGSWHGTPLASWCVHEEYPSHRLRLGRAARKRQLNVVARSGGSRIGRRALSVANAAPR